MSLKRYIKEKFFYRLPWVRTLYKEVELYKKNCYFPAGHYYSPVVELDEVRARTEHIWKHTSEKELPGINVNFSGQLLLCRSFEAFVSDYPYTQKEKLKLRHNPEVNYFSRADSFALYGIMRHYQPKRIIEVGSGYSTSLILDCNELFFSNKLKLTCIEPDPARLFSLISEEDKKQITLHQSFLQDMDLSLFDQLEEHDILFIDSTHVCKTGSDVNDILFEILPRLKKGVLIHFHDIFWPFVYPKEWVLEEQRNWNEAYALRAFLSYNQQFRILFFPHYLQLHQTDTLKHLPELNRSRGQSLWLIKN